MSKSTTQSSFIKTALRVPPDLHADLHDAAKAAERGFNAEVLFRLRQSFKGRRSGAKAETNTQPADPKGQP